MNHFDRESFTISGQIVNKKEKEFLMQNDCRWCAACKKAKNINEFYKSQYSCKKCSQLKKKQWDENHPDYYQSYRDTNKDKQKLAHRSWFERNKEKKNAQNKEWYQNNKESVKSRLAKNRQKNKSNPQIRLRKALRQRIYGFLLGAKSQRTMELVGCSMQELKLYFESLFSEGMTWENYGNPNGDHSNCWHVDHIKPCCLFDLANPEEVKTCFHYTNLQPLWAKDNMSKSGKF